MGIENEIDRLLSEKNKGIESKDVSLEKKLEEASELPVLPKKELKKLRRQARIGTDWGKVVIFLSIFAFAIIITINAVMPVSFMLRIIFLLIGACFFLPIGVFLGWVFLDPYMRCRVIRRLRPTRNYGVVHFVEKGGKRIFNVCIKSFDGSVIEHGKKVWILHGDLIYNLDKKQESYRLSSEHIITLPMGVPCLFLDSESMQPLTFYREATKISPSEIGGTLLGWLYNQLAKAMFFKRTMQIFYVLTLGVTFITLVLVFQMYNDMSSLKDSISHLEKVVRTMVKP